MGTNCLVLSLRRLSDLLLCHFSFGSAHRSQNFVQRLRGLPAPSKVSRFTLRRAISVLLAAVQVVYKALYTTLTEAALLGLEERPHLCALKACKQTRSYGCCCWKIAEAEFLGLSKNSDQAWSAIGKVFHLLEIWSVSNKVVLHASTVGSSVLCDSQNCCYDVDCLNLGPFEMSLLGVKSYSRLAFIQFVTQGSKKLSFQSPKNIGSFVRRFWHLLDFLSNYAFLWGTLCRWNCFSCAICRCLPQILGSIFCTCNSPVASPAKLPGSWLCFVDWIFASFLP